MSKRSNWVVLKFGGTSVSSRINWQTISKRIEEILVAGERPLIVCSALSGVSDLLESLIRRAPHGEHHKDLKTIVKKHLSLAEELGLPGEDLLLEHVEELKRLAHGAELVQEISPNLQARIMATGELMSTRLGAAFLNSQRLPVAWSDARELLRASSTEHGSIDRHFLSAVCSFDEDPSFQDRLDSLEERIILTQGFIASDDRGRTVLLGRGGSDTSASYFASRLGAIRLEIWTDVPGMFTANPKKVPHARLLLRLDYDEAQELASLGGKVLHPRCIPPARKRAIPIHIRCTPYPNMPGTMIVGESSDDRARVKAVSAKHGVTVVSMDTLGMWQQVGFLSDVFQIFKTLGISIDIVATSESNVSITLDPMANLLGQEVKDLLLEKLNNYCNASIREGCAVVSLVGRGIRSILSRLAPALEVFEEHNVYLVSQAASDLNLSLVVDEEQADRLVENLHVLLLGEESQDSILGPKWRSLDPETDTEVGKKSQWWKKNREKLLRIGRQGSPAFVYSLKKVEKQAKALMKMESIDKIFYSLKANPHQDILRSLEALGAGFECVSIGELELLRGIFPDLKERVLFTPNFAARSEYEAAYSTNAMVTLDNLHPVINWPKVFAGREVLVRIDPGHGRGHHDYVRTAGPTSKFGVSPEELPRLAELAKEIDMRVMGLHAHVGSGVTYARSWADVAVFLESFSDLFPRARALNLGGGLAILEQPEQATLDLKEMNKALMNFRGAHPDYEIWMEPGRFLVAEAGVLLAKVTQTKKKGIFNYVGLETGMNALIRPALYGSYHGIVNLSRIDDPVEDFYEVVGPICESGDVLGHSRRLPRPKEGDIFLIDNCGAYGRVMSSQYNMRPFPGEFVI